MSTAEARSGRRSEAPAGGDDGRGLAPAPPPRATPRVGHVGVVLSLAVTALGLAGVHDGLVALGWLQGTAWLERAASASVLLRPGVPASLLAAAALLLGLWLLATALRPGARRGLPLAGSSGAWLRPRDASRLAAAAAREVDGVTAADVSVDRGRAKVRVRSTSPSVREEVEAAVSARLAALASPPRVKVTVDTPAPGGSR